MLDSGPIIRHEGPDPQFLEIDLDFAFLQVGNDLSLAKEGVLDDLTNLVPLV